VARKRLYKGISFTNYDNNKMLSMYDVDLVKKDLMNHIFTRFGERIMMPRFGTRIPDLLFEPLDSITIGIIHEDLRAVIDFDPRVVVNEDDIDGDGIRLVPSVDEKTLVAYVSLRYVELDYIETIEINLEFNK
jgi:phage baseplate assembly protein W